jgi:hypothetical protein
METIIQSLIYLVDDTIQWTFNSVSDLCSYLPAPLPANNNITQLDSQNTLFTPNMNLVWNVHVSGRQDVRDLFTSIQRDKRDKELSTLYVDKWRLIIKKRKQEHQSLYVHVMDHLKLYHRDKIMGTLRR